MAKWQRIEVDYPLWRWDHANPKRRKGARLVKVENDRGGWTWYWVRRVVADTIAYVEAANPSPLLQFTYEMEPSETPFIRSLGGEA